MSEGSVGSMEGVRLALDTRSTRAERDGALPRGLAAARFEAWCAASVSARGVAAIVDVAVGLGGRLSDDLPALRLRVLEGLRDGRVLMLREGRAALRNAAAPSEAPVEAPPPAVTPRDEKTWITIQLVDDHDPPRPVAHARYRVRLPDDTVREGRLDASGLAHLADIDPGLCEVTFPDYDRDSWRRV